MKRWHVMTRRNPKESTDRNGRKIYIPNNAPEKWFYVEAKAVAYEGGGKSVAPARKQALYDEYPADINMPGKTFADGLDDLPASTVIMSKPIYLAYRHFNPQKPPKGPKGPDGWRKSLYIGPNYDSSKPPVYIYTRYQKFNSLTSGELKKFIKDGIKARPGTTHVFFETLHKAGRHDGLPVYEVGMGS